MMEQISSTSPKHRIFISYTNSDKELANYLTDELRRITDDYDAVYNFALPGTQNSIAGSRPGDNFQDVIEGYLKKCNVFILLWSENARRQVWINNEVRMAKRLEAQKPVRSGKKFKLIPISIDRCGLPFGLKDLVRINYTSGANAQATLNHILNALGLPEEHGDPHIIFLQKVNFEVKTAFERKEWSIFIQKYTALAQTYPSIICAEAQYRYAIALLSLGQPEKSLMAAYEGLSLDNKEGDLKLLKYYVHCLREKRLWKEIVPLIDKVREKVPTNAEWLQLHWEVVNHMNSTQSFFLNSSPQMTQQSSQTINMSATGTNGERMPLSENASAPFVSSQQFPSLFQSASMAMSDVTLQQLDQQLFTTQTSQDTLNNQPNVTRKLSEEELQVETDDDTWQKANAFTEKHISYSKIEKLLDPAMLCIAIVNIVYIACIAFLSSSNTYLVAFEAIGVLLILGIGRFVESEAIKLGCITLLIVFWAVSGWWCGHHLYEQLNLHGGNSLGICIGIIFAIIIISVGGRFHLQLFYKRK